MIVEVHPPGKRDPDGLHAVIWESMGGQATEDSVLTPAALSYEAAPQADGFPQVRAYVEPLAASQAMPDMPLFLKNGDFVMAPLQATYDAAFDAFPPRWQVVL